MLKRIVFLLIVSLPWLDGISQSITNIRFSQKGQQIEISYNISGAKFNQDFYITVHASTDGGNTFTNPLKHVSGDVGVKIPGGHNKKILWDVYKEMPDFGGNVSIDVRAVVNEEKIKREFMIGYRGSGYAPLGAQIGLTGAPGFYLSARINPDYFTEAAFETNGEIISDYNDGGYYAYSGKDNAQWLILNAGLQFQVSKKLHLYLGAGYSVYNLNWEVKQYDYPDELKATSWARHTGESFSGLGAEAGMTLKLNNFLYLSGGISVPYLKEAGETLEGSFGFGVMF